MHASSLAMAQDVDRDQQTPDADRNDRAREQGFRGAARDAWLTGKVETVMMLNTRLNSFRIDTDVENGRVTLSGEVENEVDRDLAGELTREVEGVDSVENNLRVVAGNAGREGESLGQRADNLAQWMSDRTTTAVVKSRLFANNDIQGLRILVDTQDDIVTLSGTVRSDEERRLAEQIAQDTRDVTGVRNLLVLDTGS